MLKLMGKTIFTILRYFFFRLTWHMVNRLVFIFYTKIYHVVGTQKDEGHMHHKTFELVHVHEILVLNA